MSLNIKPFMPLMHPHLTLKKRRLKLSASSTEVESNIKNSSQKDDPYKIKKIDKENKKE